LLQVQASIKYIIYNLDNFAFDLTE
jgi:hypothetical protein